MPRPRARRTWPQIVAPIAVVVAVVVAACGSAGPGGSAPSAAASGASSSGGTLIDGLSIAEIAVRAQLGRSGCRARQIAVSTGEGAAGQGRVGLTLLFRNTGSSSCLLTGYPAVTLVTGGGRGVQARRTRIGYLGGLTSSARALPVVRVGAGRTVSAYLEGVDANPVTGGGPCPAYAWLLVTAPNQSLTFRLLRPVSAVCDPKVHPVVGGTSGRGG